MEIIWGILGVAAVALALFVGLFNGSLNLLTSTVELLSMLMRVNRMRDKTSRMKRWGVIDMFEQARDTHGDSPMITFADTGETITFKEMDERTNQVAHWATNELGVTPGTTVALLMPNSIEYVAVWLGLAKCGATIALLNTNLSGAPLLHAIRTALEHSTAKVVIAEKEMADANLSPETREQLRKEEPTSILQEIQLSQFNKILANQPSSPVSPSLRDDVRWDSTLFYIYTSGTTGLPKASKIGQLRFWMAGSVAFALGHVTARDRLYCVLPLYHASGGMIGMSLCLQSGCTLVLRSKFSVSKFSNDIVTYKCTCMQYIGELCRYLVSAKANPLDGSWPIRFAIGNGMRPDVWERFQRRYNVQKIVEFYAATEGNTNLFNNTGVVGAVGVVPWFAKSVYPVKLVKYNTAEDRLERDANGRCIECKPGEVGQIIGLIKANDPSRRFDGYTDKKATEKKIARNVFKEGDTYFLSGDLLKEDSWGFYYWHDRIGDTFRWKGENVSTAEVAGIVARAMPETFQDVNCYGVEVPKADGRAGMAAITLSENITHNMVDWAQLYSKLQADLASYAQPVFIRIVPALTYTTTFKHKKTEMRDEGFSLSKIGSSSAVYVRDPQAQTYVQLTPELEQSINDAKMRL